jgi:hypothetical protein
MIVAEDLLKDTKREAEFKERNSASALFFHAVFRTIGMFYSPSAKRRGKAGF